eukprot:sb/3473070/
MFENTTRHKSSQHPLFRLCRPPLHLGTSPADVPLGRPPGISQKSKISYRLLKLDKSRLLPTNLDPLNTMLPTKKLSKVKNMPKIDIFCLSCSFSVGSIVFSGSKLVGNNRDLSNFNKRQFLKSIFEVNFVVKFVVKFVLYDMFNMFMLCKNLKKLF